MATPRTAPAAVVLLIEDNASFAHLTTLQLEDALGRPVDVVACESVASAIAWSRDRRPGCVVLDLHLPDCFGLECLDQLRGAGVTAPVVVLSGAPGAAAGPAALAAGASAFVPKGAPAAELAGAVRAALDG